MTGIGLDFTRYEVNSLGSLSVIFEKASIISGIYRLDFSDGKAYIGQSVNLQSRLNTHRRKWADRLVCFSFAPCPSDKLNEAEFAMIQRLEREGISLENKLLASRPQGAANIFVTTKHGQPLPLPWERESRPDDATWDPAGPFMMSASQVRNFYRLASEPEYPQVKEALRAVLEEVMPAPRATAGVLWTLTALPSTASIPGYRRLCTLNAGRLEILYLSQGKLGQQPLARLNLASHSDRKTLGRLEHLASRYGCHSMDFVRYSEQTLVLSLQCPLESLAPLIKAPLVADLVYELVVRQMRMGMNPLRKHFNTLLFEDVWSGA